MKSKTSPYSKLIKGAALGMACGIGLSLSAMAQAVDFSGERVEFIMPFKEGGGSDTWARFFSPLISEQLPGQPAIVVKNIPGGGSTKGANIFQQRAGTDGLTVLGTSGSTQFPYLLGDPRVNYEYKDWKAVLASPTGGVFYVSADLGIKSAADLRKLKGVEVKYASQGATSLDLIPLLAMDIMGLDVNAIFGMKGRGAGRLAFERGEVNVDYQTSSAYLTKVLPLVEEGKAVPIMSWGVLDEDGNLQRDPTFPDLPHFAEAYEMMHGKKPSGIEFKVWKTFFAAGFAAQKGLFLPKETPDEVVDAWTEAVKKAVASEGFKARSEEMLGSYPQAVGKQAQKAFAIALDITDGDKEWIRNWLTEKYGTQF
ncbi:tricarboxylate transporter [Marinobacterium sp. D7]|uniref:Bug family tripartite tricarboxylate transporter substrate binding protein n=1 Tax=Marinobacterium ramblicola TaxID=2849041 RepID=UPI001C2CEEDE|nr:tripartite tricarboxylate transporter substrate-binding protein [Marinobacterium ramblicola]MBV1789483.1 tricarboxylate transporter [Marinobacterium ramblicola]